ncbi:hypothetical protein F4824DRAFT_506100 [Ustulina deusta]|nr:hypothetical protein F4823DRAFT_565018 [Ustulina deusta]KAI3329521.1 hypothetical protein F4824DRAFT_506100 [Ustulina deusta]
MSDRTHRSGAALVPRCGGGGLSTTTHAPNLSDEQFRDFKKRYEIHVLPAITQLLDLANIGGQVHFRRRKFITIVTREEAPPGLKHRIECVVAAELREDIRAKISIEFEVGEVVRAGS